MEAKDFREKVLKWEPMTTLPKTKSAIQEILSNKGIEAEATEDGNLSKTVILKVLKSEEDYFPTESELKIINGMPSTLRKLSKEEVRVFTFQAADTNVDRAYEHFTKQALQKMAELAVKNSIPFLTDGDYDHQTRQRNVKGVVFDAMEKGGKLLYKVYLPVIARTKDVIECILAGLYSKLSVGFSLSLEDYVCDTCKKSMFYSECPHFPGSTDEKGNLVTVSIKGVKDNYEISGVAVPCQQEAHIRRSLESVGEAGKAFESSIKSIAKELSNPSLVKKDIEDVLQGLSPINDFTRTKNMLKFAKQNSLEKDNILMWLYNSPSEEDLPKVFDVPENVEAVVLSMEPAQYSYHHDFDKNTISLNAASWEGANIFVLGFKRKLINLDTIVNDVPKEPEMDNEQVTNPDVENEKALDPAAPAEVISEKADEPATPAEAEVKEIIKEVIKEVEVVKEVKVSLEDSELVALVKSLVEQNVAIAEKLESIETKLAMATEVQTDSLTKKLKEAGVETNTSKHWLMDKNRFNVDLAEEVK